MRLRRTLTHRPATSRAPEFVAVRARRAGLQFVPPGHFYSPIPLLEDLRRDHERIFRSGPVAARIPLHEARQLELLATSSLHASSISRMSRLGHYY
jgi:hypothetical protein